MWMVDLLLKMCCAVFVNWAKIDVHHATEYTTVRVSATASMYLVPRQRGVGTPGLLPWIHYLCTLNVA
jgi:hypothetical protein